jgi:hypothetical protein
LAASHILRVASQNEARQGPPKAQQAKLLLLLPQVWQPAQLLLQSLMQRHLLHTSSRRSALQLLLLPVVMLTMFLHTTCGTALGTLQGTMQHTMTQQLVVQCIVMQQVRLQQQSLLQGSSSSSSSSSRRQRLQAASRLAGSDGIMRMLPLLAPTAAATRSSSMPMSPSTSQQQQQQQQRKLVVTAARLVGSHLPLLSQVQQQPAALFPWVLGSRSKLHPHHQQQQQQ